MGQRNHQAVLAAVTVLTVFGLVALQKHDWPVPFADRGLGLRGEEYFGCPGCERRNDRDGWVAFNYKLGKEAAAVAAASPSQPLDVLFLGDSITEAMRGTAKGRTNCRGDRCRGVDAAFNNEFKGVRTHIQAIGGDQTSHVLYRLNETPAGELAAHAGTVVLHIGTNDLNALWNADGMHQSRVPTVLANRIASVVDRLIELKPVDPRIVVLAILPRAKTHCKIPAMECGKPFAWPDPVYGGPIATVNAKLAEKYESVPGVTVVNCNDALVDGEVVPGRMMPDSLHPSPEGTAAVLECLHTALHADGQPHVHAGHGA